MKIEPECLGLASSCVATSAEVLIKPCFLFWERFSTAGNTRRVCLLCSDASTQEASSSSQPAVNRPALQLPVSPVTAFALATNLVECILSTSPGQGLRSHLPGYQLLGQLALADVQHANARMKGVAQHVMSSALKVLLWRQCLCS